jgi:hypothetical protein
MAKAKELLIIDCDPDFDIDLFFDKIKKDKSLK